MLLLLLCANTAIFISVYVVHLREVVAPQLGRTLAGSITVFSEGIKDMSPEERTLWLSQISRDSAVKIEPVANNIILDKPPPNEFLNRLDIDLRKRLGSDTRLSAASDLSDGVHIDFTADAQRYRLSMPSLSLMVEQLWPLAWLLVSSALIIWGGVMFAVWQVNRPLQRSAESLARSSNELAEMEMPSSAPLEFRVFAERFNKLARRLAQQEHERAVLLAGVSHDLRAPLTRMRLCAELLDESSFRPLLVDDVEFMQRIVDQFLEYQRQIIPRTLVSIDLLALTQNVISKYRNLGREVSARSEGASFVMADSAAVERVLHNLVENALSHGAEPVEIGIHTRDAFAVMEVRDHGPGIPQEQVERVMRPFERLDSARGGGGHCGLGLPIAQRLVDGMGGRLVVTNHRHGGLLVRIHFVGASSAPHHAVVSPRAEQDIKPKGSAQGAPSRRELT
jgi:two-component system osmolarity sensor histidine kinase EnvZ